jgi:hypothetical protein
MLRCGMLGGLFSFTATIRNATNRLFGNGRPDDGPVSDQAVSSTYQAREAATILYAALSNRANNETPNSFLARNNFIWADLIQSLRRAIIGHWYDGGH